MYNIPTRDCLMVFYDGAIADDLLKKKNIVAGKHAVFPNNRIKKKLILKFYKKKIRNNHNIRSVDDVPGENGGTSRAVVMRVHNTTR